MLVAASETGSAYSVALTADLFSAALGVTGLLVKLPHKPPWFPQRPPQALASIAHGKLRGGRYLTQDRQFSYRKSEPYTTATDLFSVGAGHTAIRGMGGASSQNNRTICQQGNGNSELLHIKSPIDDARKCAVKNVAYKPWLVNPWLECTWPHRPRR